MARTSANFDPYSGKTSRRSIGAGTTDLPRDAGHDVVDVRRQIANPNGEISVVLILTYRHRAFNDAGILENDVEMVSLTR